MIPDVSLRLDTPAEEAAGFAALPDLNDDDRLARIEAKIDALHETQAAVIEPLLEMLEKYGPLLEKARQRLERPRFGRR